MRKALEATHSYLGSGRPGSLMSALSHSVHMLIRKKCHAAGNLVLVVKELRSSCHVTGKESILATVHYIIPCAVR